MKKGKGGVAVRGWVYRERGSNKIKFIVLRDSSNIVQCVLPKEKFEKQWNEIDGVTVESSVEIEGRIRKEERAPTGYEIDVEKFELINRAEPFPITKDINEELLLDRRHLWLRSRKMISVLKIRSTVFNAIHEYFRGEGFYEYQSPIFQSVQAEGGSTLFEVKYFDKKTYLAQTWQLYAEPAIFALEKIYTIAPSFRAEASKTARHLTEYWHAEMEAAWVSFDEIQDFGEGLLKHIVKKVLENNKQELEIAKKERGINIDLAGLSQAIRELHNSLQTNLIQIVLAGATISDTFANVEAIEKLTESIKKSLNSLREDKSSLETQVTELNLTRVKLIDLEQELRDEKTIIDNTRSEKALLLTQTRNKEADYRKLLAQKRELREEFERELTAFETQLRISIDSKNLPVAGTKILSWPLENAFVTQYFGNTEFARANAYNGKGHNGIDLRASAGTKVASAADGTVTAIGDTDQGCPGGSYGKWVLVNHRNGLSTLYAHLSLIKVASGIEVNRGDIVGYSGNTGYSTGPHLHLTVYASEGVRVSKLTKPDGTMSKCGDMPISPLNGYLNPLLYL